MSHLLSFSGVALEAVCPLCEGKGHFVRDPFGSLDRYPRPPEVHPCGQCAGKGIVLTDEGYGLLGFLAEWEERSE